MRKATRATKVATETIRFLLDFFLPTKIKMAVDIEAGREEVGEESVTQVEEVCEVDEIMV